MNISEIRRDYIKNGLRRKDLHANPLEQFSIWFKQAVDGEIQDPSAMILATASASALPTQRTVLLKGYDEDGFLFFTNYESTKAKQIAENTQVSLLFPWLSLERQVILTGTVDKLPVAKSLKYFISRPIDSQLGAWASAQSSMITSRKVLDMKFQEMKEKFKGGKIPLPSFWGGYRVIPQEIEFWQGGDRRLHDRFLYTRVNGDKWGIARLAS